MRTIQSTLRALAATLGVTGLATLSANVGCTAAVSVVARQPTLASASSTTTRATTPTMSADQSGCATIHFYDVGPGRAYSALRQLPWSRLKGCDTVRIHAKPSNGTYNEMLLISAGTDLAPTAPNQFMRVIGVPDPATGALPIIDGTNATQLETLPGQAERSLQYHDTNTGHALYKLGLVMVGPQLGYNYSNGPAGYISIENLDIRNAAYGAHFTDAKTGIQGSYVGFTSCLYVEAAAHLVVKNNVLHGCGNGLFINSKNSAIVELSQDVLIDGNSIYNNSNPPIAGVSSGYSEHNSYTEARDIIYQYNTFGDVRPGAFGDCLKDRSSGLVVRYNRFASTCQGLLHLVDSTGGQALIWGDAGYGQTHIYGNLFDLAPAPGRETALAIYGGDSGAIAHYRKGTLHFYNNTMVVKGDAGHGIYPEMFMFYMLMPGAVADARNNVLQTSPTTVGAQGKVQAMALGAGTVAMASNWVSPNAAQFWIGHPSGAVLTGWNTNLGAGNNPKFVNAAQHDYRPAAASPLINAGASLSSINASLWPLFEPYPIVARKKNGIIDVGAYEF